MEFHAGRQIYLKSSLNCKHILSLISVSADINPANGTGHARWRNMRAYVATMAIYTSRGR